jgi:hypothetical protein
MRDEMTEEEMDKLTKIYIAQEFADGTFAPGEWAKIIDISATVFKAGLIAANRFYFKVVR